MDRKWVLLLCLMILVGGISGCAGNADVIKALAVDQATVCVRVTTIYGTLTAARSNIIGGDVTCDTLVIKSQGQVSIPVTVVPSTTQTPVSVQIVPTK